MERERMRSYLRRTTPAFPILLALILASPWSTRAEGEVRPADTAAAEADNSCVTCHSDPQFLVTNKKLYDYFQDWSSSVHRQEGVLCEDCHGGNARLSDKSASHGNAISPSHDSSPVNFRNIPKTCGQVDCHQRILEGFSTSDHAEHVIASDQADQGPTCVTCHGSINVEVLNVNSVEEACARCHNEENENHPGNPAKARAVLNRFLSIYRFYRYITIRAEPEEAREFFQGLDQRLFRLSVTWHTFDLEKIEDETYYVLTLLKMKRDEIRRRRKIESQ